jgi:UDP-2,3-diacylglucosamine pyrophosphatase LpxH
VTERAIRHSVIISDLHLGSEYCNTEALGRFIDSLHDDAELILNGDVFDRYSMPIDEASQAIYDQILARAESHPVTWLQGNHDKTLSRRLPATGAIRIKKQLILNNTILIEHGDRFEKVLHYARPLTTIIYQVYLVWQRITGHHKHVACYAKQWSFLYNGFCHYMKSNAVKAAAAVGCTTVICGHSHHPEDTTIKGIRYINTGAWTELPVYCTRITNRTVSREVVG